MTSYLAALRPEAAAWLDALDRRVRAELDPSLHALLHAATGHLVGADVGSVPTPTTDFDRRALAFAEQFVLDVSLVPRGFEPDFVRAVFVVEYANRLAVVTPALLDGTAGVAPIDTGDATLKQLLDGFQGAVMRGSVLDPVTAELVRLRCARTHHCRICQTLRLGSARDAGVDDAMTAKIDFYERSDLPERAKTALRVTDAVITSVGRPSDDLRARARAVFSQAELAALCLEIMKWSTQKIHVALGTDGAERLPLNDEGVSFFDFTDEGVVAGFRSV